MKYEFDLIDGRRVPPLVISEDTNLRGAHNGSIHVEQGTLNISGKVNGSLDVQSGTRVLILGHHNGSIAIAENATVIVSGFQNGSIAISSGGNLIVEATGKSAGSLINQGQAIVRGAFGGSQEGNAIMLEGTGYIKQPEIRNGICYYSW